MTLDQGCVHSPVEADEFATDERCFILESWNREDDPGLSIARARVAPGVTTRLHRLSDTIERYLILSGAGVVEVEGMAPRPVRPGDVVYIPAGSGQRIANPGTEDLVFLALCTPRFRPEVYQDMDAGS